MLHYILLTSLLLGSLVCFCYPRLTKGYKLMRLDTHALFVSRHVKFFESIFPYHQISKTTIQFQTTTSANSYDFLNWIQTTKVSPSSSEYIPNHCTSSNNSENIVSLSENVEDSTNNITSSSQIFL